MLITKPFRTIALLGREPGILVLKDALLNNPLINLVAVYTHGALPKKEGGGPRPELSFYNNICNAAEVPLHILDLPEARKLEHYLPTESFDLLIVLSWRCILPRLVLEKPNVASINLHRGALPKYKGAEPVLQAIKAGEKSISITAHHMTEELDEGPIIGTANIDISPCPENMDNADYAEKIKVNLYPFYAPLVRFSIESLTHSSKNNMTKLPKKPIPNAIFLDLDGTLADSLSVMRNTYQLFLKQFQCNPTDNEFDLLNGPPLLEVVRQLKFSHALQEAEETLLSIYSGLIDRAYTDVKSTNGAIKLLQTAKKYSCIIGVVTSNTKERTKKWLETVGITQMIDFIVSGEDVTEGKPHPQPYLEGLKKLNCNIDDIVAIEDSPQGAQSAINAGLKTFVLSNTTSDHLWPLGVEPVSSFFQVIDKLFKNKERT